MGTRILAVRRAITGGLVAASLALVASAAACATPQPTGVPGRIVVTLAVDEGGNALFEPKHRARAISVDGTVAEWELTGADLPIEVPAGIYRLEAFTFYLSDTILCADPIGGEAGGTCFQPTLGPGEVCTIEVEVVAGAEVRAAFRSLEDGGCELEPEAALPT